MKKSTKDSANSFKQLRWEHAAAEYERMKSWAANGTELMRNRAVERMRKLESSYPILSK